MGTNLNRPFHFETHEFSGDLASRRQPLDKIHFFVMAQKLRM